MIHEHVIFLRLLARPLEAGVEVEAPPHLDSRAEVLEVLVVAPARQSAGVAGPVEERLEVLEGPEGARGDECRVAGSESEV